MLLVAHGVGDYTLMGSTLDDSVGKSAAHGVHACSAQVYFKYKSNHYTTLVALHQAGARPRACYSMFVAFSHALTS